MGERMARIHEVRGSIPLVSTKYSRSAMADLFCFEVFL